MLIVEDGTGLEDAESYVSVEEYRAYCEKRGLTIVNDDEAALNAKAIEATEFVDSSRRYKGVRKAGGQAREFPRTGCTDWSDYEVEGVPRRVKDATLYLMHVAEREPLFTDLDRGGKIKSESVAGVVSTTYADDAPTGKCFTTADRLLEQYVRDKHDVRPVASEMMAEPESGVLFRVGMHDMPGGSTELISEE